ncbi:unnamed protein product [Effrenium voratum]|nr:unnamed protein product [Effrenium voratum]
MGAEDYGDFEDFLKLRGFQNEGQEASLTCRERTTDPEIRCSECVRLLKGGFYGHLGVSVPAYPPQGEAMGCLGLSKVIDMPAPATEEDDSGDWDGAEGRQTAFCNSVNVRFEKASLAERGEATRSSERSSLQRHRIHELVHLLDSEAESLKAMARTLRKESGGIEDQISEAEESAAITAATAGVGMLNSAQSAVGATRDAGARDAGQALRGSPEQVRAQSLEELGRQTETSFAQQDARPGRRSQTSKTLSPEEQRLQALLDMRSSVPLTSLAQLGNSRVLQHPTGETGSSASIAQSAPQLELREVSIRKHTAMARFSLLLLASLAAAVRVSVASASAGRLVSVADLHGDFERAVTILAHAGLIDKETQQWTGGDATLVQTGDITDRGDNCKQIYELFLRLRQEAQEAGGRVVNILGNHEVMNLQGDWRYVSQGDLQQFGGPEERRQAFAADGWLGKELRSWPVAVVVQGVLFNHAGLLPDMLSHRNLEDLNVAFRTAVDHAMGKELQRNDYPLLGSQGPVWARDYALGKGHHCRMAEEVLSKVQAERMVLGHTIQQDLHVHPHCNGRIVLADTAISSAYGGAMSYLEHKDGEVNVVYPGTGEVVKLPAAAAVLTDDDASYSPRSPHL